MESNETTSSRLTFEGPYDDAFAFVEQLRAAGLTVTWRPPDQERGGVAQDIVIGLVVSGFVESVKSVVSVFIDRRRVKIRVDQSNAGESEPKSEA